MAAMSQTQDTGGIWQVQYLDHKPTYIKTNVIRPSSLNIVSELAGFEPPTLGAMQIRRSRPTYLLDHDANPIQVYVIGMFCLDLFSVYFEILSCVVGFAHKILYLLCMTVFDSMQMGLTGAQITLFRQKENTFGSEVRSALC